MACIDTQSIEVGTTPIDPGLTNLGKVESVQTEAVTKGVIRKDDVHFEVLLQWPITQSN